MIYDLDATYQNDLTLAFAAGERRGREHADEALMAECVDLQARVEQHWTRRVDWQRVEGVLITAFASFAVVGSWAVLLWAVKS